jgi:hypothetical protein
VLAVSLLALATPLPAYVSWPHPELFCFGLTTAALLLAAQPRARLGSALLLAVAATQNLPLLLFFPLHLLVALQRCWPLTWWQLVRLAASYLPAVLLVAATLLWTHHCFGVFNVITGAGMARGSYASWTGVAAIFGGPLIGALWYYPMCLLLLPAGARWRDAALLVATTLAVATAAWLCTTTANFNSDQVGAWRYTAWLLAPFWYLLLTPSGSSRAAGPTRIPRCWKRSHPAPCGGSTRSTAPSSSSGGRKPRVPSLASAPPTSSTPRATGSSPQPGRKQAARLLMTCGSVEAGSWC